jgi:hypothetical protein
MNTKLPNVSADADELGKILGKIKITMQNKLN